MNVSYQDTDGPIMKTIHWINRFLQTLTGFTLKK